MVAERHQWCCQRGRVLQEKTMGPNMSALLVIELGKAVGTHC